MSAQHTPGPWASLPDECDKPYIRIRGTQLGSRYKIANVLTPVYEGAHEREAKETRANARLIAAAPDLLEAAKLVIAWYEAEDDHSKADFYQRMEMCRESEAALHAAIVKVKGETS